MEQGEQKIVLLPIDAGYNEEVHARKRRYKGLRAVIRGYDGGNISLSGLLSVHERVSSLYFYYPPIVPKSKITFERWILLITFFKQQRRTD